MTANELARDLGVSRRTVFRDLAVLRSSGFDIPADPVTQRLRLVSALDRRVPFAVGDRELLLVSIALGVAAGAFPALAQVYPLVSSLATEQKGAIARQFSRVPEFFEFPAPRIPIPNWLLVGLVKSFLSRTSLRVTCRNVFGMETCVTLLSPYRMRFAAGEWFAVGRSSIHRRVVWVPLAAVEAIEPTSDRFSIPPRFKSRRDDDQR